MSKILGVKFRPSGKMYYFSSNGFDCKVDDSVIAEIYQGVILGKIIKIFDDKSKNFFESISNEKFGRGFGNKNENKFGNKINKKADKTDFEIHPIIRVATQKDIIQNNLNRQKAQEARRICLEKIQKYGIKMRIIDVEYTFDRKKVLFYFSADGKIDFRELVRDLASVLRVRIELRQIGVRDQARILGGLGICGQPFCCHRFLNDFGAVSIKMAKEQGLSLNPVKLSGNCGRLLCCLQYEQDAYEDLIKEYPRVGNLVKTVDGEGEVIDVNLITGFIKVILNSDKAENNNLPKVFHKKDVEIINKNN